MPEQNREEPPLFRIPAREDLHARIGVQRTREVVFGGVVPLMRDGGLAGHPADAARTGRVGSLPGGLGTGGPVAETRWRRRTADERGAPRGVAASVRRRWKKSRGLRQVGFQWGPGCPMLGVLAVRRRLWR